MTSQTLSGLLAHSSPCGPHLRVHPLPASNLRALQRPLLTFPSNKIDAIARFLQDCWLDFYAAAAALRAESEARYALPASRVANHVGRASMPTDPSSPDEPSSLAIRLESLFAVTSSSAYPGRPLRNREVAAACRASGRDLSESHLSELRRGVKRNPTLRTLETLAWFFAVPASYFTSPDETEVERELAARRERREVARRARDDLADAARELQETMRRTGVTNLARRRADHTADYGEQAAAMRALTRLLREEAPGGEFTDESGEP